VKLGIYKETKVRIPRKDLVRLFDMVVAEEGDPEWSTDTNLVFTTDERIHELNRQFRAKDMSTDVLSFNIDEADEPGGVFGEIYISVPFAKRQADGYGGTQSEEFLRLFCHGLLHLFGYDHMNDEDENLMVRRHEYFLARLGARS